MKQRGFPLGLQAVLASKLQAGSTEQQSEALMHGILLCERFVANAQGTEAELEVLKQEVRKVLSGQAARQRAKKTAQNPHKPGMVAAEQPQQVLARATSSAKSSHSSESSQWLMPGILIEPKAHVKAGDFDRIVVLQDRIAEDKGKEHTRRDKARQEQLRVMLDSQMQDVERQRQAEAQQRKEEAAELKANIRAYEQHLVDDRQRVLNQQQRTRHLFNKQVAEARERRRLQQEHEDRENALLRHELAEEQRREQAQKVKRAQDDKVLLAKVMRDNDERLRTKAQAAAKEREDDRRLNEEAGESLLREEQKSVADQWIMQEQKRLADLAAFQAKTTAAFQRAGGEALTQNLAQQQAADEARMRKLQAQHDADQDAMLAKRRRDAQERERVTRLTLDRQMEERRQREAEEQADDARRAVELQRQAEQDKAERKAAKAALQQHKKQLHKEQVQEVKEEAKRRFKAGAVRQSSGCAQALPRELATDRDEAKRQLKEYQGLLDDKDRWLHDAVLHGGKPAFTSQFDS
eukprot:jgi/Astpho2/3940/fgenesh1_pg.00063_%23_14_t